MTTYSAERPHVLTNGSFALSPWIAADDVERKGALVVWSRRAMDAVPSEYGALGPFAAMGAVAVRFPGPDTAEIGWAVKAPSSP